MHPADPPTHTPVPPDQLTGPRVRLRPWCDADREPFAAMNADPVVMAYFHAPLTRAQSDASMDRIQGHIDRHGWGFWAADLLPAAGAGGAPRFMGFVGLNHPPYELPFSPCVEAGWRLARPFWGQGLATEAARLALRVGFGVLELDEVVAMANKRNLPSRAVMQRLGMVHCPQEDFEHPAVPVGSHARLMCLYRLRRPGSATAA